MGGSSVGLYWKHFPVAKSQVVGKRGHREQNIGVSPVTLPWDGRMGSTQMLQP